MFLIKATETFFVFYNREALILCSSHLCLLEPEPYPFDKQLKGARFLKISLYL